MNSFVGKYVALIRQTRVWMIGDLEDTKLYCGGVGGEFRWGETGLAYWGAKKR